MWNPDLRIHARGRNYRVPLKRRLSRIGRGSRNDIVLLDPSVPQEAGSIELRGGSVRFRPFRGEEIDCRKRGVRIGRYLLSVVPGRSFLLTLTAAASLAGASLAFGPFLRLPAKGNPSPPRTEVISLPARGVYGRLSDEAPTASPLRFRFEHDGKGSLLLHYVPGGVRSGDRLLIDLNGNPAGFVPATSGGWGIEQRLLLPSGRLKFGRNRISITPVGSDEGGERWGVRDLYVTKVPASPAGVEDAKSLVETAERIFREGRGDLGEIERSAGTIRRAIESFRLSGGSVPQRAVLLERKIASARDALFDRRVSEARKASALGQFRRARSIYLGLLSELPDRSDLRRVEVGRALGELGP